MDKVIDKAITSCQTAGCDPKDHFLGITKMVDLGSGSKRRIDDIALTRYACYLIAQNGDPAKEQIAFAQTYFAVQTRKQEVIEITNFNIKQNELRTESGITGEHIRNNREVRKLLVDRGIVPEALPPAEDVKKVDRRLQSEQKRLPTQAGGLEEPDLG